MAITLTSLGFVVPATHLDPSASSTAPRTALGTDWAEDNDNFYMATDVFSTFSFEGESVWSTYWDDSLTGDDEDWFWLHVDSVDHLTIDVKLDTFAWVTVDAWDEAYTYKVASAPRQYEDEVQLALLENSSYTGNLHVMVHVESNVDYSLAFTYVYCVNDKYEDNDDQPSATELEHNYDEFWAEGGSGSFTEHYRVLGTLSYDWDWVDFFKVSAPYDAHVQLNLTWSEYELGVEVKNDTETKLSTTLLFDDQSFEFDINMGEWLYFQFSAVYQTGPCSGYEFVVSLTEPGVDCQDDTYENNDDSSSAFDVTYFNYEYGNDGDYYKEDKLVLNDTDWYFLYLTGDYEVEFTVETHDAHSLSVEVYNAFLTQVDWDSGLNDFFSVTWTKSPGYMGEVLLKVTSYSGECFSYILKVHVKFCRDDAYEENDDPGSATDVTTQFDLEYYNSPSWRKYKATALHLQDVDFFQIDTPPGTTITVVLDTWGDAPIDVYVGNNAGVTLASINDATSWTNLTFDTANYGETRAYVIVSAETYPDDVCVNYDLHVEYFPGTQGSDGTDGTDGGDGTNDFLDISVPGAPVGWLLFASALATFATWKKRRR
ncbi:MAG: hypothetical protein Kow0069_20020 [Promethearchaeota archaeon]